MAISVRDISPDDEAIWRQLWAGYLAFYEQTVPSDVTDHTWSMLFDDQSPYWGLVAEDDTGVIGFAIHQDQRSSWNTAPIVYLEDLFVADTARGSGAGRALMEAGMKRAKDAGSCKYYWQTDTGNATARHLYDSLAGGINDRVTYELAL